MGGSGRIGLDRGGSGRVGLDRARSGRIGMESRGRHAYGCEFRPAPACRGFYKFVVQNTCPQGHGSYDEPPCRSNLLVSIGCLFRPKLNDEALCRHKNWLDGASFS